MLYLKDLSLHKETSNKVIKVLVDNNCSSILDIKIIYNIIMGFPFLLEHGCLYKGEYYEKLSDLPEEAKKDFKSRYVEGVCSVDPNIIESKS